ncbi:FAD-dependent oxidoreductase [Candidatus Woesearchaeota archaeon]|nr:FAD-dependent oxidoreductase [Candidatus Woesearchaeota archaeon]
MPVPEFTITLDQKRYLTDDVMYLSFTAPKFSFKAGQYALLKIIQGEQFRWKPYSILNPPQEKGKIDVCAKIIPGGFASEYFKEAKPGDTLVVRGPIGLFVFDENDQNEIWFVCAGTGVVPFYSMIKEYLPRFPHQKFVLLFGVRQRSGLFFHDEFTSLQQKFSNFTYIPTLSRDQWNGKTGRVQRHLPSDLQGKTFYLCGLKEMVLETKELLLSKRVPAVNIKVERYT